MSKSGKVGKRGKIWSKAEIAVLTDMVHHQMITKGFVNFEEVSQHLPERASKACEEKAKVLDLSYHCYQKNVPAEAPKPKYDMITMPKHKNGLFVDYWENNKSTKRVNYPAVWQVLRSKKV